MTATDNHQDQRQPSSKRHGAVAAICGLLVLSMAGLSFAAVPLYRLYCQVTGYQGTTQKAAKASDTVLDRVVKVHFDANTAAELPWTFEPMQSSLEVKVGENTLAFYKATNNSDKPTTGTAVFNVTPDCGRPALQQGAVLLLHRAAAGAGAVDRNGGFVLRRSDLRHRRGDQESFRADAVLCLLSGG